MQTIPVKNKSDVYWHFASALHKIHLAIKRLPNYFVPELFFPYKIILLLFWGKKSLTSKSMKTSSSRLEHPSLAMMSKVASMLVWLLDNVSSISIFKYFLFRLIIDSLWQITMLFITHWCTTALLLNFRSAYTERDVLDSIIFARGNNVCCLLWKPSFTLQHDFRVINLGCLYVGNKLLLTCRLENGSRYKWTWSCIAEHWNKQKGFLSPDILNRANSTLFSSSVHLDHTAWRWPVRDQM